MMRKLAHTRTLGVIHAHTEKHTQRLLDNERGRLEPLLAERKMIS